MHGANDAVGVMDGGTQNMKTAVEGKDYYCIITVPDEITLVAGTTPFGDAPSSANQKGAWSHSGRNRPQPSALNPKRRREKIDVQSRSLFDKVNLIM